jgi:hypothetical protein
MREVTPRPSAESTIPSRSKSSISEISNFIFPNFIAFSNCSFYENNFSLYVCYVGVQDLLNTSSPNYLYKFFISER